MRLCKFKRPGKKLKQPFLMLRNLFGLKSGEINKNVSKGKIFAMKHCQNKGIHLKVHNCTST